MWAGPACCAFPGTIGAALLGRLVLGRGLALFLQVLQEFYAMEELLRQALAEEGPEESLARQLSWMRQGLFSSEGQALPSREERHARGA